MFKRVAEAVNVIEEKLMQLTASLELAVKTFVTQLKMLRFGCFLKNVSSTSLLMHVIRTVTRHDMIVTTTVLRAHSWRTLKLFTYRQHAW